MRGGERRRYRTPNRAHRRLRQAAVTQSSPTQHEVREGQCIIIRDMSTTGEQRLEMAKRRHGISNATGATPVTAAALLDKLRVIPPSYPTDRYQYNANGFQVQGANGIVWGAPAHFHDITQANQDALWTQIEQDLAATARGDYQNGGGAVVNNIAAQQGPYLITAQRPYNTNNELTRLQIAKGILECIIAYRVYRGLKRSKTGQDAYDPDDQAMLSRLSFLGQVLNNRGEAATMNAAAIRQRLIDIKNEIHGGVVQYAAAEPTYEPRMLGKDERFTTTLAAMRGGLQALANWQEPPFQQLNAKNQNAKFRHYDICCVLGDNIKSLCCKQELTNTDISSIRHSIELIEWVMGDLQQQINVCTYSTDNVMNEELKEGMNQAKTLLTKRIYTSIALSITGVLRKVLDRYDASRSNQSESCFSPKSALRRYRELIQPAEKVMDELGTLNDLLSEYSMRKIDNNVLNELSSYKELFNIELNA